MLCRLGHVRKPRGRSWAATSPEPDLMTDDDLRLGAISCRARYAPGTTALAYTVSRDGSALGRVHSFAAVAWLNAGDDPREIIARRLNEFDERRPRRTLPPRSTSRRPRLAARHSGEREHDARDGGLAYTTGVIWLAWW